jgi:hypothetical protein
LRTKSMLLMLLGHFSQLDCKPVFPTPLGVHARRNGGRGLARDCHNSPDVAAFRARLDGMPSILVRFCCCVVMHIVHRAAQYSVSRHLAPTPTPMILGILRCMYLQAELADRLCDAEAALVEHRRKIRLLERRQHVLKTGR